MIPGGVIVEQFLRGSFNSSAFYDQLGALVVAAYQTDVVMPGLNNKKILNVEQGSLFFTAKISSIGIPGGVDMAMKDPNPATFSTEIIHHCLPAVAFLDNGNQVVYAWGNTKDMPILGDHNYIGILLDVAGNPLPGSGGQTYRLIDYDPSINPNVRAIALSSNNDNTGDLYMVYAGDVNVPTYSECLYQKEAEWWRIQSFGFRPAGIDDNQTVQQFFKVYPSPFQNQFALSLSDNNRQKEYQMTMSDIFGRVVFKAAGNTVTINKQIQQSTPLLQQLSSGMYLIRLDGDTQSQSIKIIKD